MYFLETLQVRAPSHGGVLYSFFDIDGMLFEFFINFLNIEIFYFYFFQYFMFCSRFMLFPTLKKKFGVKQNFGGGGLILIVDILVGNLNMKLTGRWFPQIVDRDSGNLYPAGADPGGGGQGFQKV